MLFSKLFHLALYILFLFISQIPQKKLLQFDFILYDQTNLVEVLFLPRKIGKLQIISFKLVHK